MVLTPTNTTVYLGTGGTLTNNSGAFANPALSYGGTSYIGSDSGNDTRVFNGIIDDVAFFNRSLSTAEVDAIYRAALEPARPITSLTWAVTTQGLVLTWSAPWKLLQADVVSGPYTAATVTSGVPIPMTAPKRFYRLQY